MMRHETKGLRSSLGTVVAAMAVISLAGAACSSSDDEVESAQNPATTVTTNSQPPPPSVAAPSATADEATTTRAPDTSTTTAEPLTLEERITANMQGVQLEYLDFWGDREFWVTFHHHGDWASELTQRPGGTGPDDYCERSTYAWSVTDAKSESEFTIHYETLAEDPDCALGLEIENMTAVFTGAREVDGRIIYDFAYVGPDFGAPDDPFTGTRTVCSDQWNDPEPCGLPDPNVEMSTPPPG